MFEPEFLSESQAAPFLADDKCISAWLGECNEGALAAGSDGTVGYRLLELSHLPESPDAAALGVEEGTQWTPLRASRGPGGDAAAILASQVQVSHDDYAALFATARGLALWHRSVRFCAVCGGETRPFRDGANQKCVECGARFRPRTGAAAIQAPPRLHDQTYRVEAGARPRMLTMSVFVLQPSSRAPLRVDPSVIMLVTKGDRCLLGRQASWPVGATQSNPRLRAGPSRPIDLGRSPPSHEAETLSAGRPLLDPRRLCRIRRDARGVRLARGARGVRGRL